MPIVVIGSVIIRVLIVFLTNGEKLKWPCQSDDPVNSANGRQHATETVDMIARQ